ncbi:hypothetical protein RIF29_45413 [Crotalaria pallida]|uniref:Uncharacterized protein n=1 Tax=Crotalaria pallida TaxID=3830 RepID=A0AAN9DUN8_CROPI
MSISRSFLYSLSIPSGPPDIHSLYLGWPVPIFALFPSFLGSTPLVAFLAPPSFRPLVKTLWFERGRSLALAMI